MIQGVEKNVHFPLSPQTNQREVSKMSSLWSLITVSFECGPVLTSLLSPYQGIKTEKRIILS